jgi:hypothetical protein
MNRIGDVINGAVSDFYRNGPRDEPGPGGAIIAALGWAGLWISEDVTPLANEMQRCLHALSAEISKINLAGEWAGPSMPRQRQVDEIGRLLKCSERLTRRSAQTLTSHVRQEGE